MIRKSLLAPRFKCKINAELTFDKIYQDNGEGQRPDENWKVWYSQKSAFWN